MSESAYGGESAPAWYGYGNELFEEDAQMVIRSTPSYQRKPGNLSQKPQSQPTIDIGELREQVLQELYAELYSEIKSDVRRELEKEKPEIVREIKDELRERLKSGLRADLRRNLTRTRRR